MWVQAVFDGGLEAVCPVAFAWFVWFFRGRGGELSLVAAPWLPQSLCWRCLHQPAQQLFFSLTCLVFWLRGYLLKLQVGDVAELQ